MERVRSLSRSAGLVLSAAVAAGGLGCASTSTMTETVHSVRRQVLDERPAPATQVGCLMRQSLTYLPDPTRDGQQVPGLPGTVFLLTQASVSAEVDGDLAVMVYDETPRPPGVKGHEPELWHFDRDTLARLGAVHEWFGKCYGLFLLWPANWNDVTQVRIQARYESKGYPTLYSSPQTVTLDFSKGNNSVFSHMQTHSPSQAKGFENRSVPDPQRYIQQAAQKLEAQRSAIQRTDAPLFTGGTNVPPGNRPNATQTKWPVIPNQALPPSIVMQPGGIPRMPSGPTMPVGQPGPNTAAPATSDLARPIILPDRVGQ